MLRTALGGFLLLAVTFGLLYQRLPGTPPATLSEPSAVGDSNMAAATAPRAPSIYITHGGEEDWPTWCLQFVQAAQTQGAGRCSMSKLPRQRHWCIGARQGASSECRRSRQPAGVAASPPSVLASLPQVAHSP